MPHEPTTSGPSGETGGAKPGGFNLRVLLLLSCGHMVVDIYQGALPAILPFLKDRLDLSYAVTGAILMVSSFASSMIQPLFGFLSD